ncbi:Do family serine endopeptidase [Chlamydiia bacterium]|nr:Do family serine endopeptidase [Chlamydiia bacterium]
MVSFADLVEDLTPSVVNISSVQTIKNQPRQVPQFNGSPFDEFFNDFFNNQLPNQQAPQPQRGSLGSGFIYKSNGYIVTNYHVIKDADEITVVLHNEESYVATIVGKDKDMDLAVLKIDAANLKAVLPADPLAIRRGDWVIAIGNPFGLGGTVTAGIVSGMERSNITDARYQSFIQTDAPINPGNSGGPLFDLNGNLVGINNAILSRSGGNQGIGFAIDISNAKPFIDQLIEFGETQRGWLGVMIQPLTDELASAFGLENNKGVVVARVEEGSPAEKGGLKDGDVIFKFNGDVVESADSLPLIVARTPVGTSVEVKILRDKKHITKMITLGRLETAQTKDEYNNNQKHDVFVEELQAYVSELTSDIAKSLKVDTNLKGVVVVRFEGNQPTNKMLSRGSIITHVNQTPVSTPTELQDVINAMDDGVLLLKIHNKGYLGLQLSKKTDD